MSYEAMECVQLAVKCIKNIRIIYKFGDSNNNILLDTDGSATINGNMVEDLQMVCFARGIFYIVKKPQFTGLYILVLMPWV